jgi:hypothetical protein
MVSEQTANAKSKPKCVIPEWVQINMRLYGNSVIGNDLVKCFGKNAVLDALKELCGCDVSIREIGGKETTEDGKQYTSKAFIAEKVK